VSTERVEQLLAKLKLNPATVIELYPLLAKIEYRVLIAPTSGDSLDQMLFLTYPTADSIRELPAFTSDSFSLLISLRQEFKSKIVQVPGRVLFEHLIEKNIVAYEGDTVLAVNPGSEYSIRLSREILKAVLALPK
jgi:hypothetical protein